MTWFKVDDGFSDHPKVRSIPRKHRASAIGLWTLAGAWSSRHLTEGVIPGYMLEDLGCTKAQADALVSANLWHRSSHACHECVQPGPGSYVFHAWCERNPSRAQVERERQASADRQRKARERRRQTGDTSDVEEPYDLRESEDVTDASRRDTSDVTPRQDRESRSRHAVPTRPDPTRPYPTKDAAATQPGQTPAASRDVALFDPPPGLAIVTADTTTAQTLVGEWLTACAKRPPGDVIGQVSKHLKALLEEGHDAADVRAGLIEWHRKGLHPRTLSSVVNEVMNRGPQRRPGQDIDWAAAMERARAREASA